MAIQWTDIENGEVLVSIRNKLNAFNNATVQETGELASGIQGNLGKINITTADVSDLQVSTTVHYSDNSNPHAVTAAQAGAVPLDGTEYMTGSLRIQTAGAGSKLVLLDETGTQSGGLVHNRATGQVSLLRYDDLEVVESGIMLGSDGVSLVGPNNGAPVVESPQDITTKEYVDVGLDSKVDVSETLYGFDKVSAITLTEAELLIGTINLPSIPTGTYEIGYSFEINFGGIRDKSVHFRADIDGATGTVFDTQSDKNSNHKNRRYSYPKDRTAGAFTMNLYMWKEAGVTQEIIVDWCDLTLERKK